MPGLSERKSRLRRAANPLRPVKDPYYLQRPNGPAERAPGWYMELPGIGYPTYIGANHVEAEIEIVQMVKARRVPA